MRRIKVQTPAFIQPKGLPAINKDAMDKVKEVVTEKAVELVEQKAEEVEKKVEETADKVLDTVQENTQVVADKVEDAIETVTKPITDLIDKLDDNPAVKKVIDGISESIVEQVDGRVFSCSLFGWLFALRITRKTPQSSPTKSEETENKPSSSPPQHEEVKESLPPTPPSQTETSPNPPKDTSASS
jgi:hypothetical protein